MRPKVKGSSTTGMKKSVVATSAWLSFSRQTAASSLMSAPTISAAAGVVSGFLARISRSTACASLQPQPRPCASSVRR